MPLQDKPSSVLGRIVTMGKRGMMEVTSIVTTKLEKKFKKEILPSFEHMIKTN